jgi:hypothetical protein
MATTTTNVIQGRKLRIAKDIGQLKESVFIGAGCQFKKKPPKDRKL